MIDVKEAAKVAVNYFRDLYGEDRFSNILLEEIEHDPDGEAWLITIGYSDQVDDPFFPGKRDRHYKIFRIDEENGFVRSMKIRTVENA